MPGVLAAWLVELGLITYRDIKGGSLDSIAGLPLPADYLATFIIFGGLGMLARTKANNVAGLLAWGVVIATYMNLVNPADPLGSAKAQAPKKTASPAESVAAA